MFKRAETKDAQALAAFLQARIETSLFLLGNLRLFGLSGDGHDYALAYWIARRAGEIVGVLGLARNGTLLVQAPRWDAALSSAAATALAGREITAANGEAAQVDALLAALGLDDAPCQLDERETLMRCDLDRLTVPPGAGDLVGMSEGHDDTLLEWRRASLVEAVGEAPGEAPAIAARNVSDWRTHDSHRLLIDAGVPLALTGFNTTLPGIVQVGGVYTPPDRRGRGHARRAVALHLVEARRSGVTRAVLFTHNPAARRAYDAVGFEPIGRYRLVAFVGPQTVRAPS